MNFDEARAVENALREYQRHGYASLNADDKARMNEVFQNQQRSELEALNRRYGVIETIRELDGFTVLGLDRYKPGVVRFYAVDYSKMIFRSGLAKDELFAAYQLPK